MPDREPPVVTLVGGGTSDEPPPPPSPSGPPRRRTVALVLAALLVLAVLLRPDPPPAEPPPSLQLLADGISVSQSGVLVVPVLLRAPGAAVELGRADAYAEPVRDDPVVQAPDRVEAGARRRLVVLLRPDCRLLTPQAGLVFRASLLVRVVDGPPLVLDLGAAPAVVQRVAGLCG